METIATKLGKLGADLRKLNSKSAVGKVEKSPDLGGSFSNKDPEWHLQLPLEVLFQVRLFKKELNLQIPSFISCRRSTTNPSR